MLFQSDWQVHEALKLPYQERATPVFTNGIRYPLLHRTYYDLCP
jgi:hypothetical protein